jgi:hypothetical protein
MGLGADQAPRQDASNTDDYFFAPDEDGIALFDGDSAINRDVSDEIGLWNAGTEVDQPLGMGNTQAPFQSTPNFGPAEDRMIQAVDSPAVLAAIWCVANLNIRIQRMLNRATLPRSSRLSRARWSIRCFPAHKSCPRNKA